MGRPDGAFEVGEGFVTPFDIIARSWSLESGIGKCNTLVRLLSVGGDDGRLVGLFSSSRITRGTEGTLTRLSTVRNQLGYMTTEWVD